MKNKGVCKNRIIDEIRKTIIPRPPLTEQKRTVEKPEELLSLFERLKQAFSPINCRAVISHPVR